MPELLDITAPEVGVQVQIKADGKVLWVHVDGVTVLRVCQIPKIEIQDDRPAPYVRSAADDASDYTFAEVGEDAPEDGEEEEEGDEDEEEDDRY